MKIQTKSKHVEN